MPTTRKTTRARASRTARNTRPTLNPPTRPLSCHQCGKTESVRVESDTDRAKRGARTRITAQSICDRAAGGCGNRWSSVHPDAVRRARALAKAEGAAEGAAEPRA